MAASIQWQLVFAALCRRCHVSLDDRETHDHKDLSLTCFERSAEPSLDSGRQDAGPFTSTDNASLSTDHPEALSETNLSLQPWLQQLGLRFFMPKEIANMHSFPSSFGFPSSIRLRKQYALVGNSVSAAVVCSLLRYLLTDVLPRCNQCTCHTKLQLPTVRKVGNMDATSVR